MSILCILSAIAIHGVDRLHNCCLYNTRNVDRGKSTTTQYEQLLEKIKTVWQFSSSSGQWSVDWAGTTSQYEESHISHYDSTVVLTALTVISAYLTVPPTTVLFTILRKAQLSFSYLLIGCIIISSLWTAWARYERQYYSSQRARYRALKINCYSGANSYIQTKAKRRGECTIWSTTNRYEK